MSKGETRVRMKRQKEVSKREAKTDIKELEASEVRNRSERQKEEENKIGRDNKPQVKVRERES